MRHRHRGDCPDFVLPHASQSRGVRPIKTAPHRAFALLVAAASVHCSTAPEGNTQRPPPVSASSGGQVTTAPDRSAQVAPAALAPTPPPPTERELLVLAEQSAPSGARRVLATARTLIDDEVIIRGTCFTWLNAVYRQAGGRFSTVFSGDRRGRYASADQLAPGDWVRFVNHSYGGVTHSAIFIAWIDRASSTALTVSYPGERRETPGRYREYALTSVYQIDRMRE
jgi:hypothetical protein